MISYKGHGLLIDDTLILSDLHLGYEEAMQKKGVLVPKFQFNKIFSALSSLLKETKPKTIVINGDLKHEFSGISDQEWREIVKIFELINLHGKLILVKGNHDTITPVIAKKKGVEVFDHYYFNGVYVCHGDVIPEESEFKESKIVVIGHEHPAMTLKEGAKQEKYKCFLRCKWNEKVVYVLPSFSPIVEGSDILKEKMHSPFLRRVNEVEVTISQEGKLYPFGMVKLL